MWSKIYFALLGVAILLMGFFTFYSWSWIQSIGDPAAAVEGYSYHATLAWTCLWIALLILMILGNIVAWATGRGWGIWTAFLFFAIFTLIRFLWLDTAFDNFTDSNRVTFPSGWVGSPLAVVLIPVLAAVAFFDNLLLIRLREKMYGTTDESNAEKENSRSEETES